MPNCSAISFTVIWPRSACCPGRFHCATVSASKNASDFCREAKQNLHTVLAELVASRQKSQEFFGALTEAQWNRPGLHAEYGQITLNYIVAQFGTHDLDHIEQITRILSEPA